jgi:hypothetical protein
MESRATSFVGLATLYVSLGILAIGAIAEWDANQQSHKAIVIVGGAVIVGLVLLGILFARRWFISAFLAARSRGESVWRAIVNSARIGLATRLGRAGLGGIALVTAIASAPGFLRAIQEGHVWDAVVWGVLLGLAALLNGMAVAAAGSVAQSAATLTGLVKWERVFGVEDEVGPAIDFAQQGEVRFRVKPLRGNQWRFGLKFSSSDEFAGGRYSPGYPLWHLTKEENQDSLSQTYYDEFARSRGSLVRRLYHDEEIALTVRRIDDSKLEISVDGDPSWAGTFDFRSHRHAQHTAWADGREFLISVQLEASEYVLA